MHFPTLISLRDQSKVSGPAHHLLLMLALHGYRDTNVSCPSVGRLAHTLGVTPRHVRSLLKELVAVGAIHIQHGGGRQTNTYEVIPPHALDELSTPRHSTRLQNIIEVKEIFERDLERGGCARARRGSGE